MKKKTKVSRKRLNNLLMILLLTAVLLIMSTYAWFTANRTVKIESIDVNVATSSGLQISADGETWKTILTKDDIFNAYNNYPTSINQLPTIMAPISTIGELDDAGHMKMFYGSVAADMNQYLLDDDGNIKYDTDGVTPLPNPTYGEYLLTTSLQTDKESSKVTATDEYAKGYYMAFDVFLKLETPSDKFYMSGTVTEPGTKGLSNAARVGIIKSTESKTTDASLTEIQGISTVGGQVLLWEPNYDAHTQNAINNGTSLGWTTGLSVGENNAYIPYDGVKAPVSNVVLSKATAAQDGNSFGAVTPTYKTLKSETPSMEIDGGLAQGITKMRIYFWVEGQDIDCENNASGTDVILDMSFSLDPII